MRVALVNCLLLDGTISAPQAGTTVVLDGTKIVEIGSRREFGADTRVVDLDGRTVMPGLIDCHIHFALWVRPALASGRAALLPVRDDPEGPCRCPRRRLHLRARPGRPRHRPARRRGRWHLCRTEAPDERHDHLPARRDRRQHETGRASSCPIRRACRRRSATAGEARAKVREVVRAGADFIKIAVSGWRQLRRAAARITVSSPRRR